MGFRNLVINRPAHLSISNENLLISGTDKNEPESFLVPVEDIASIVIEGQRISLTSSVLSTMAENKVSIISCDSSHLPVGINTPYQGHVRQLERIRQQIKLSEPFKKQLWKLIIVKKIQNQSHCLNFNSYHTDSLKLLSNVNKVKSGDTGNIEGISAKFYFTCLFGINFYRGREDSINASLNYGYAIIRSEIAKQLVAYGFLTALGLHHRNEYNNFNLADDLIEPYRPVVDQWVYRNIRPQTEFTKEVRHSLIGLLGGFSLIDGKKNTISNSIEITVKSLVTSINYSNPDKLLLPDLLNL